MGKGQMSKTTPSGNVPFVFYNCTCGYNFVNDGGDMKRLERSRNMKIKLHKKNCKSAREEPLVSEEFDHEVQGNRLKGDTLKNHAHTSKQLIENHLGYKLGGKQQSGRRLLSLIESP